MQHDRKEKLKPIKIYLDVCCLNRPFDDQSNERIRIEAEAVFQILKLCKLSAFELYSSEMVDYELNNIEELEKRNRIYFLLQSAKKIKLTESIENRAEYFKTKNIDNFDALHLALAETECDIIFTVDDKLLKKCESLKTELKIETHNPLKYIAEHIYDKNR